MLYPSEILPNPNYKSFKCLLFGHKIIRTVKTKNDSEYPSTIDDLKNPVTNEIKEQYICDPSSQIGDLSVNLFGIFNGYHNNIELIGPTKLDYIQSCDSSYKSIAPKYPSEYEIKSRFYWWMKIENIHLQEIEFIYKTETYKATCHIVHSPAKWNYWHFLFNWNIDRVGFLHEIEEKERKKIIEKLKNTAKGYVKQFAECTILEPVTIKKSCYQKNVFIRCYNRFFN